MKERPILFSSPMVRALLDGRKTQTRRVMRVDNHPAVVDWLIDSDGRAAARALTNKVLDQYITTFPHGRVLCPYGVVGDRLWVRETFAHDGAETLFAADCTDADLAEERKLRREFSGLADEFPGGRWRPSIHMPRALSRINLEVTGVRVERLHEISDDDCESEGIKQRWTCINPGTGSYAHDNDVRDDYKKRWVDINGTDSWAANPWVWVIEFKRVTP